MKPFWIVLLTLALFTGSAIRLAESDGHLYSQAQYPERLLQPDEVWVQPKGNLNVGQLRLIQITQSSRPADMLIFGNSRIQLLSGKHLSKPLRLFNLNVSGASLEDILIIWRAYRKRHPAPPRYIVVEIDPDVMDKTLRYAYYADSPEPKKMVPVYSWFTLSSLYRLRGLFSWDGLRVALQTIYRIRDPHQQHAMILPRNQLPASWTAFAADGSVIEPVCSQTPKEIISGILSEFYKEWDPMPFNRETQIPARIEMLRRWLTEIKTEGSHVYVFLPPYHPVAFKMMDTRFRQKMQGFSKRVEKVARTAQVSFCDAMDPRFAGCQAADFRDDIHARPECIVNALRACFQGETGSPF